MSTESQQSELKTTALQLLNTIYIANLLETQLNVQSSKSQTNPKISPKLRKRSSSAYQNQYSDQFTNRTNSIPYHLIRQLLEKTNEKDQELEKNAVLANKSIMIIEKSHLIEQNRELIYQNSLKHLENLSPRTSVEDILSKKQTKQSQESANKEEVQFEGLPSKFIIKQSNSLNQKYTGDFEPEIKQSKSEKIYRDEPFIKPMTNQEKRRHFMKYFGLY